jgi:hypothetical protein
MGMLPRLTGARIIRMSIYTIGIAVGAAMLTRDPWTIAMLGLLASLPIIPLNAVQGAFLALQIPDQLRGRVLSASTLVTAVLVAPAPLLAGALLDTLGYDYTVDAETYSLTEMLGSNKSFFVDEFLLTRKGIKLKSAVDPKVLRHAITAIYRSENKTVMKLVNALKSRHIS